MAQITSTFPIWKALFSTWSSRTIPTVLLPEEYNGPIIIWHQRVFDHISGFQPKKSAPTIAFFTDTKADNSYRNLFEYMNEINSEKYVHIKLSMIYTSYLWKKTFGAFCLFRCTILFCYLLDFSFWMFFFNFLKLCIFPSRF